HLPDDYWTSGCRRYPVIYWLHGRNEDWHDNASVAVPLLEAAVRAGVAPASIVVWPNGLGDSGYIDSYDGKRPVETVIVKDLIPHVDATYRTLAFRAGRSIEGYSMGGSGAARLGFKYPELFGAISIM